MREQRLQFRLGQRVRAVGDRANWPLSRSRSARRRLTVARTASESPVRPIGIRRVVGPLRNCSSSRSATGSPRGTKTLRSAVTGVVATIQPQPSAASKPEQWNPQRQRRSVGRAETEPRGGFTVGSPSSNCGHRRLQRLHAVDPGRVTPNDDGAQIPGEFRLRGVRRRLQSAGVP